MAEPSPPLAHDLLIVGGGVSGLSLAWNLRQASPDLDLVVLEAGARPGGTIATLDVDGFRVESGPNGVLDRMPDTLDLARGLGMDAEILRSSDAARRRFLLVGGKLHLLPETPPAMLRTRLLSFGAKLRAAREPFVRRAPADLEETVAQFVRRRLGSEVLEVMVDAFLSGVYAGDPEEMSLDAALPKLREIEQRYGSLIRGGIRMARARKSASIPTGPVGALYSFDKGMGSLPLRIAEKLGSPSTVRCGTPATSVGREGATWVVGTPAGALRAHKLVLALPAHAAARLLLPVDGEAAGLLGQIPYAGVAVVALGYRRDQVQHALDGFGFLCPGREGRPLLGCLFSSSVWPEVRAPEGHVLLRVMLGGRRQPEQVAAEPDQVLATALSEVVPLLGIEGDPVMKKVLRWPRAIPQYTLGHRERLAEARERLGSPGSGLYLHGNAYAGIGVNNCTAASAALARKILGEDEPPGR